MTSITEIPLDLWRGILVRLPAETLFRARAVSKVWRARIDDPCFVRAHTNNQISSKIIFFNRTSYSAAVSCYSLDLGALINSCSSNGHLSIAATPIDLDFASNTDSPRGLSVPVLSECNGLVLTGNPSLTIWNPLTRERLDLPRGGFKKYVRAFGLGYDSTSDDYKAVVILSTRETHVYSLKSDSWRSINNCPCDIGDSEGPIGPGVFEFGALNWLSTRDGGRYGDKIVALDIRTENYRRLQMPKTRWHNKPPGMLLNVLGGCLALSDSACKSHLDVWVMKDYGNEDSSWIKLFSIGYEVNISVWGGFLSPVAFFMEEKLVFLQDGRKFYLFDVETKSLKWVKIDGSIIAEFFLYSYAKQMLTFGTIFRLHANCGVRKSCTNKKRKIMSCTKKNKKKSTEDVELVFCRRDANGMYQVSCSQRGCHFSGESQDGT